MVRVSKSSQGINFLMIKGNRVIAVIPARGGSKGVKKKNIKKLAGKPLISWSIELAKNIDYFDKIIVSTDDYEIRDIALRSDVEVYNRPSELATDESVITDVIKDLLKKLKNQNEVVDIIVMLEPTCPLRNLSDVERCLKMLTDSAREYDSIATFKKASLNPHRAWKIENDMPISFMNAGINWLPRQELPKAYQLDGGAYAFFTKNFIKSTNALLFGRTGAVIVDQGNSIDIDTPIDFHLAEMILKEKSVK